MSEPVIYREQAKDQIRHSMNISGDNLTSFEDGVLRGLAAIAWALLDVADSIDQAKQP